MTKLGRDDLCKCGSNKKYKNCCYDKDNIERIKNLQSTTRVELNNVLILELINVLDQYNFFDLSRAVFCINAYRSNRSELEFLMSMHKALLDCSKIGSQNIESFAEFNLFFKKVNELRCHIKEHLIDKQVPDFGEVQILYNSKCYPVLIGNGYNFVFALTQFIEPLMQIKGIIEDFEHVLSYVKNTLISLQDANEYKKNEEYCELYTPSEIFFEKCKLVYNTLEKSAYGKLFAEIFFRNNCLIEKMHFIEYNNKFYPLFNASILVDAYHTVEQTLNDKERNRLVRSVLYGVVFNNYYEYSKNLDYMTVFFDIALMWHTIKNSTIIYPNFLLLGAKSALIIIDESCYTNNELSQYIKNIKQLFESNKLEFLYQSQNDEQICIPIKSNKLLSILSFGADTKLDNFFKGIEKSKKHSYTLFDIVYLLCASKSVDEICEFIEYDKCRTMEFEFEVYDGKSLVFEMWRDSNSKLKCYLKKILVK